MKSRGTQVALGDARRMLVMLVALKLIVACCADAVAGAPPKLIVVVSVDQLCYEYLERFKDNFADDGFFRRVEREGSSFSECHHRHAFTYTAPGHSVLTTGTYPRYTGIVGNGWFDPALMRDRYCCEDKNVKIVGLPEGVGGAPMSPESLQVETLGDALKRATGGKSKVIGISLKDRAGILMAGRKADAAYWLVNRRWVTSTWYAKQLPGYLRAFNESGVMEQYAGQTWKLLLPSDKYHHYRPDDYPFENEGYGLGRAFPHTLAAATDPKFDEQFPCTPFGNELTLSGARLIIAEEKLGQHDVPDMFCLGLSSNDYLGHQYGPYSLEVEDAALRLDRQLGEFVKFLDAEVGAGQWVLALSADHAVAPIPEFVTGAKPRENRRNPLNNAAIGSEIEGRLRAIFGPPPEKKNYVLIVEDIQVFLTRDRKILPVEKLREAREIARDVLLQNKAVYAAVIADDLQSETPLDDVLLEKFRKTFNPARSGDVLWVLRPYFMQSLSGTTHGSPWRYDTNVPLVFLGSGVGRGKFVTPSSPAQIGPTLAKLLGIEPPKQSLATPAAEALASPKSSQ